MVNMVTLIQRECCFEMCCVWAGGGEGNCLQSSLYTPTCIKGFPSLACGKTAEHQELHLLSVSSQESRDGCSPIFYFSPIRVGPREGTLDPQCVCVWGGLK